jgi:adenylate cyclase
MNVPCLACKKSSRVEHYEGGTPYICPHCNKKSILPLDPIPEAFIVALDGDARGSRSQVWGKAVMGRAETCDIQILDTDVSRQHAELAYNDGHFVVKDLGSRNGVIVNDQRVNNALLNHGDIFKLGPRGFRLEIADTGFRPAKVPEVSFREMGEGSIQKELSAGQIFSVGQESLDSGRKTLACLQAVYQVSEDLVGVVDTDKLLDRVLSAVIQVLKADRAFIVLRDPETNGFTTRAARFREERHSEGPMVMSQTILNKVLTDQVSMLVADAATDARFDTKHSIITQGIRSVMCAPLAVGSSLFGVLTVDTLRSKNAFDREDLKMLTSIARQSSIALEHARLIRQVEDETRKRGMLERYLSPELVDEVLTKRLDVKPGGQTQVLTVLFADIRGFTNLAATLRPDEVFELINEYLGMMVEVLFQFEGTLDKFIGDAIMAFWGAPRVREDDAQRAVACAVQMQRQLAQFNALMEQTGQRPLRVGIGINTGEAMVGNIGSARRTDYTALGDTVNVAARLQGLAQGGQILISETTFNAVGQTITAHELMSTELRGRSGKVRVFEISQLAQESQS